MTTVNYALNITWKAWIILTSHYTYYSIPNLHFLKLLQGAQALMGTTTVSFVHLYHTAAIWLRVSN